MIGEKYQGKAFADNNIVIPSVNPQRTFLEKIFLLHEEFQMPIEKIKVEEKKRVSLFLKNIYSILIKNIICFKYKYVTY